MFLIMQSFAYNTSVVRFYGSQSSRKRKTRTATATSPCPSRCVAMAMPHTQHTQSCWSCYLLIHASSCFPSVNLILSDPCLLSPSLPAHHQTKSFGPENCPPGWSRMLLAKGKLSDATPIPQAAAPPKAPPTPAVPQKKTEQVSQVQDHLISSGE